ncbi:hypothetical protein Vafri_18322, partial [Volvox africanus]
NTQQSSSAASPCVSARCTALMSRNNHGFSQKEHYFQLRPAAWRRLRKDSREAARGSPARFREGDQQAPQTAAEAAAAGKHTAGARRSMVPVILKYGKRCNFGEGFAVVGSVPELGSWDPAKSVKMRWTSGDVWVAHVQLPVDTEVQYKYVRVNKDGAIVAWEGVDAANGGGSGPMGNINLHVRPGHRPIWGHGAEVYADLPPEYADFVGSPITGMGAVFPTSAASGSTSTTATATSGGGGGGGGSGSGMLSDMKQTARGALAALESALIGSGGGGAKASHGASAGGTPAGTATTPTTTGTETTSTTGTTATAASYGSEIGGSGSPYPSFTPAPGVNGTTIGAVTGPANAPAATHDLHVVPAAKDYDLVEPAVGGGSGSGGAAAAAAIPHITSSELAASLIAAGPAASAVSAAALGIPVDETGNIPVVTPVAPPTAAHGSGGDVNMTETAAAKPPAVTLSDAPAAELFGTTAPGSTPTATDTTSTTAETNNYGGPGIDGNDGNGATGSGGASGGGNSSSGGRRKGGFFRK